MRRKLHKMIGITLLAAAELATSAASASAEKYELSMGPVGRWLTSDSMRAVTSEEGQAGGSIGLAIAFDWLSIPLFDLYLDATLEGGSIRGDTFQRIETETDLLHGMVGARAQRRVLPHVSAFGRAAFGLARVSLSLADTYSYATDDRIEDRGLAGTTYAGAGLELDIQRRFGREKKKAIAFGLRAEAGYTAMTAVHMRAVPQDSDDGEVIRIATHSTGLGDLDLSAWNLRLAFFGRY